MTFHRLFPLFIFGTFCLITVTSLNCWYCHGKMVAEESWMIPGSSCCKPVVTECNRSYCFFAEVRGSSPFWIAGCTDDEFNGCDQHNIPYDSILLRCQCQTNLCNPIDRIPRCPNEPFNNTVVKSPGIADDIKSVAWANQIKSISPITLLILASGTSVC